jgi:hypothetical protein
MPRTSYALEVRDICNTRMDDTRATNASEVRIHASDTRVSHAPGAQHPAHIPRRCCTHDVRFICATFESQMRCKTRRKRASHLDRMYSASNRIPFCEILFLENILAFEVHLKTVKKQ